VPLLLMPIFASEFSRPARRALELPSQASDPCPFDERASRFKKCFRIHRLEDGFQPLGAEDGSNGPIASNLSPCTR
jgi:hypothetical protein